MKKKLLSFESFLDYCSSFKKSKKRFSFSKTALFIIFFFIGLTCWSQPPPPHTFNVDGSLTVPAGIIEMDVQAWGGGGAGGGASGVIIVSRSAGGGGGGAYAHGKIAVTAGATISAIVAKTTTNALSSANAAVDGAAGGSSTILGYESIIFAAGGKGGTANNAGGTPAGGQRGLASGSVGTILTASGTDGGSGFSGVAGLLQVSGVGGNAGGSGGLGGESVQSLVLGDRVGYDGNPPGGGGSGAMNTLFPHNGGAGAAGRVIVTYTCPTYSITGVSAAAVCTTPGTSEVTLSGTAAGLPTGIYTVSYKLGNPAGATVFTSLMTVTSPGTGKFTISGFTTAGTNRITITNLTSGVCSSNIAIANNYSDFTIYGPSVAGTIGAVAPICSGATSPALSLTGNTGLVLRWESSVLPFTTWTTITNTTTSLSPGTLTETTQYRAVVQNGPCSSITSAALTVTVNPLPQGTLVANGPFCATGSGMLTFTSSSGTGPFTLVYKENGGANQTKTGVVSGTPFAPTTATVTANTTYTLVSITDSKPCSRTTLFTGGGTATITVNPLPQGSIAANGPFCDTGSAQVTFTATSGTGPFTIVYKENGGADQTRTGVVSGTAFTPFTSTVAANTIYTLVSVTDFNGCSRTTGFTGGGTATITVNPLPQGSLTANGPFCVTGSGMLTFTSSAGTGPFTLVYKENSGANQTKTGVVSGIPFAPTTATVTTSTTYTLVSITDSKLCIRSTGFSGTSPVITINPIPTPSFISPPTGTICAGSSVTYTTQSGQSNYLWTLPGTVGMDYNILSGGISTSSNTVSVEWLSIGNKTVTVNYTSNGCTAVTNATNTITIIKTVPGVVNGGLHICIGDPSPLLTLNSHVGTIVRWEYAEAIPYVWQPFSHTGATYQPGILTTSTSYRAIIKNGTCSESTAIETRIDVDPRPATPTLGALTQPTCANPLGSILLNGLIGSGNWTINQTGSVYQTYNGSGTSFTVPNLAAGNYTFTINQSSSCPSLPTISFEIKAPVTNTWNGTVWSEAREPIMSDAIVFSGNYETTGNLGGCSCTVNSGVNVTVNSNHTLTITNSLNNNGGTLTFENNASLYQTTNAVNTGNITYKRNTQPIRRFDFTYWSSPVRRTPAFTMHDLSPGTLLDKYSYYNANATASGWVFSLNGTQEMLPAVGYAIRAPQNFDVNNSVVYPATFVGVPNNGPYTFGLAGADKWNLIGNPYPSAVYADQFIFDNKDNLFGALYFWTHNSSPANTTPGGTTSNYSANDYSIYNLTGSTVIGSLTGTGATTPGNNAALMGYIAAGQSFFVVSKTAGNAVFNNGMRVPGNNSQFYKNSAEKLEKNRVWINLTNTQDAFKQLLIGYIEGATNKWDTNYDAVTMDANPYLDFYSINEDKKLVVQGRAVPFEDTDVIPLGYRSAILGDFTIAIDYADGKLATQPIFLEDKTMNVWHDLRASDYTFSTLTGTFTDRFALHFRGKSLGVEEFENTENPIFISLNDKSISIKSTGENLSEVLVFDISGKMLYQKNKIENTELQITNLQSGNQVLLVKTILENGNVLTKKIVF